MRSSAPRAKESVLKELIFSIPFSFIYTHIVIGLKQKGHYFGILLEKDYLLIFIPNLFVSYLLILLIKFITRILDLKYSWDTGMLSRLILQVFFGMLVVSFFDYVASFLICAIIGIDIAQTEYFETYFWSICVFIILINIFYNYQYFLPQKETPVEQPEVLKKRQSAKKTKEEIAAYAIDEKVVYISSFGNVHFAKNSSGKNMFWDCTIADSIAALPIDQFFLVKRGLIVHRDIIDTLIPDPENHALTAVLKPLFNEEVKIARNTVVHFNKWYTQKTKSPAENRRDF